MGERRLDDEIHREPFLERPARLGWRTRYSEIIFSDPPYLILQAVPTVPLAHPSLDERGIVWDPLSLIESVRRPGGHQLLNCTCGIPDCAGIEARIQVSHPDTQTIVWELDIEGLQPALEERLMGSEGFVRLLFERDGYEADVRALMRALRDCARPVPVEAVSETFGADALLPEQAHLGALEVDRLEPDCRGMALEHLLALDLEAEWPREPVWPPGTLIEYGFFADGDGHELMRIDGVPSRLWATKDFTRWAALTAFRHWLAPVQRSWNLSHSGRMAAPDGERNRFFLLKEDDLALCHAAGRQLAAVVQACCEEGATAPGVTVRDVECPLSVAAPLP